jgi:hypothetical protein
VSTKPGRVVPPLLRGGIIALTLAAGYGVCAADVQATVRLAYNAGPAGRSLLETGMKVNVSHVDVNYATRWNEGGGTRALTWRYSVSGGFAPGYAGVVQSEVSADRQSAELWVNMARSRLAAEIEDQTRRDGIQVTFVDREHTREIVREKDLGNAGLAETPAGRRPKMLDIDAKIYAQIDIDVKLETGVRKTIQGLAAGYVPWGWRAWGHVYAGDRQKIRRIITFQARFTIEDAKTGRIWALHEASWQPVDTEKPGVFFGADKNPIDFRQPDEVLVLAFFEREIPNFVAKLVPVEQSVEVTVAASKHKACVAGVQALAGGRYPEARTSFEAAVHEHADDHRAWFGAGVTHEALGNLAEAERSYRQALLLAGNKAPPEYPLALERIQRRAEKTH